VRRPAGRGTRRGLARRVVRIVVPLVLLSSPGLAQAQAEDPTAPAPPPPAEPLPAPPPAEPLPAPPPAEALPPPPPAEAATAPAPAPPQDLDKVVEVFDDKNRVAENPALDVLDANKLNVVKPGSTKDLAADLRGLFVGGRVVPQVAVEISPYAFAYGPRTTYDDYRRHWWVPLVHRLHVSVATTSTGDGANQETLGALGVRVRLIDRSDWRLDKVAVSCALDAVQLAKPPSAPGSGVVVVVPDDATSKREARKVQECFEKAKKRRGSWNATQLALGGAVSSAFPGGKLQADIRDLAGWIGFGKRLGVSSHLVVAGKYGFADTRKENDIRVPARHTAAVAVQAERRFDRFGLLGSGGVGVRWSDDATAMRWVRTWVGQLGGEIQVRVTEGTWVGLKLSVLLVDDDDGAFVSLANFKWNFDVKTSKAR